MIQPSEDEIHLFLAEDIGSGDITARIIPDSMLASATVITRDNMVLCGQAWFNAVFNTLNSKIKIEWLITEGDYCQANTPLCTLYGSTKDLLTGERTALNLLQTLSATATIAKQYANAVAGTQCKVLDTRKTIPGLRNAQKYAVICGGCFNHRAGLYDAVLIKENHIIAAGSIELAVAAARKITNVLIEVEVESLNEYQQALVAKPDRIMLDNFSLADMVTAVSLNQSTIELEASGDVNLKNIREIAETGVDFISIGALTKHIDAINLSMRMTME
jgi:nicotinate-nucleotide pyrophosphorylase (carboxylating)